MNESGSPYEQTRGRMVLEQLLSLSPAERVSQLSNLLRPMVAAALGAAEDEVPVDAPFAQLNEAWADPRQVYASISGSVQGLIARPLYMWEFMRWPYRVGPIGSIRELAEHLSTELVIPVPEAPYADPYQGSSWAWSILALQPDDVSKNRPMVFLLAGPRSGSTLLRVMLARHPELFCGPELHLLPFESMAQRHHLLAQEGYLWMESGLAQTLAEVERLTPDQGERRVQQLIEDDVSIQEVYRILQGQLGERLLIDKSPSYTIHRTWLLRAEDLFEEPKYLYLARHPCAATESFVRIRFHWLIGNHFGAWDANPWLFAEKCWAVHNRNAIDFLGAIASQRQHWVRYEDLVTDPDVVMKRVCDFLAIPFDDAVLSPYKGISTTFELGDPNLLAHRGVDPTLATAWKRNPPPQQLSSFTKNVATELGYVLD
jgi:phthiocerol/phenolphthiocerol synthesis type-I polyketide synthase E